MSENLDGILSAALSLSPGARTMLADHLLESLDAKNQKRIDAIWAEEAARRMQEIRDGKVQPELLIAPCRPNQNPQITQTGKRTEVRLWARTADPCKGLRLMRGETFI